MRKSFQISLNILIYLFLFLLSITATAEKFFHLGNKIEIENDSVQLDNFVFDVDRIEIISEILSDPNTSRFYLNLGTSSWEGSALEAASFYSQPILQYKKPGETIRVAPLVIRSKNTGSIVGVFVINIIRIKTDELVTYKIGYAIHPRHRNKGYATSATNAVVDWIQSNLPKGKVTASTLPGNQFSRQVLMSVGFLHISTGRELCEYQLHQP